MRKLNLCALILLATACLFHAGAEEPHWMPDANLRAVVEKVLREEIGLPEDTPLQKEHMEFLVHIFAEDNWHSLPTRLRICDEFRGTRCQVEIRYKTFIHSQTYPNSDDLFSGTIKCRTYRH